MVDLRQLKEDGCYIIKKFADRKLYDTHTSSYITLKDLHMIVKRYSGIRVIDNLTNADITSKVLIEILANRARKAKRPLLNGLVDVTIIELLQKVRV